MNAKHYLIHFYSLIFFFLFLNFKKYEILDKLSSSLCVQVNDLNTRRNPQQIKQINVTKNYKTTNSNYKNLRYSNNIYKLYL